MPKGIAGRAEQLRAVTAQIACPMETQGKTMKESSLLGDWRSGRMKRERMAQNTAIALALWKGIYGKVALPGVFNLEAQNAALLCGVHFERDEQRDKFPEV